MTPEEKKEIVEELKSLKRYEVYLYTGLKGPSLEIDKNKYGKWIKWKDVKDLIKKLE